jgi:ABC-type amino acid transport system permease subunit
MPKLIDHPVALIAVAFLIVYGMATVIIGALVSGSIAALGVVLAAIIGIAVGVAGWMLRVLDDGPTS